MNGVKPEIALTLMRAPFAILSPLQLLNKSRSVHANGLDLARIAHTTGHGAPTVTKLTIVTATNANVCGMIERAEPDI